MREGRVADPGQARRKSAAICFPLCCRARTARAAVLEPHGRTTSKAVIITNIKKGKKRGKNEKRKKVQQNGGKTAAKRRRISGRRRFSPIPCGSFHNKRQKSAANRRQQLSERSPILPLAHFITSDMKCSKTAAKRRQNSGRRSGRRFSPLPWLIS
jgi:hypothetical protein